MKHITLLITFATIIMTGSAQQGKYAGSMKKLIGQTYIDSLPALKGWKLLQGSIVSPLTDPTWFVVDVYRKGTTYIAFFGEMDTASRVTKIDDVVEIKSVKPRWEVRAGLCREYKEENAYVVALVYPAQAEYSKNVAKAWRFNRDKIRFEWINPKNVDCMNEGFGE
jgi:hypothetical protein